MADGVGHRNNFNLLRLILAAMVAAYHIVRLSGAWPQALHALEIAADIGVKGFFVLSGYLVFASLERSRSLGDYAGKRVRRLYPAYGVVILGAGCAALALNPAARADLIGTGRYLLANLVFLNFLEPNLPGIFRLNPVTEVNGALWTLKIEVAFYLILPALGLLSRTRDWMRWAILVCIYAAAELWRFWFAHAGEAPGGQVEIARQLPGQMSFFITGIALYLARDMLSRRTLGLIAFPAAAVLVATFLAPILEPLRAISLGLTVIALAVAAPPLPDAARFGDLSYGIYIIHFPIIQQVVALGLFRQPVQGAVIASVVTVALAAAMWWAVERPALRSDSAYRHPA